MSRQEKHLYDFDSYRLDAVKRLLLKEGEPVPLTPKAFDTLLALVQDYGQVLQKEELMKRVWPDSFVEEGNLTVNISLLRKILGENPNHHRYIVTVPGRGYRFVAEVREIVSQAGESLIEEHTRSRIVIEEEETLQRESDSSLSGQTTFAPEAVAIQTPRSRMSLMIWLIALTSLIVVSVITSSFIFNHNPVQKPPAIVPKRTIAVLPFTLASPQEDNEHLAFGMADVLITKLNHIQQITIRPVGSIQKYSRPEQDPIAAGRELKVEAVLQGTIYQQGKRLRLTLKLINVEDGTYLWTNKFDEDLSNIFAVQDAISEQVARALEVKLTRAEADTLAKNYTSNPEAYELYMKGRYFWEKRSENNLKKSLKCFEAAVNKDQNYALAYAGLADVYTLLVSGGGNYSLPLKDAISKARAAVMKALELDESLSDAHISLGMIHLNYDWDWNSAEREFKRGLELNPNSYSGHYWYSLYLSAMDRPEEAIAEARHAAEIAPTSVRALAQVARALDYAQQYNQAVVEARKALEMEPEHPTVLNILGMAHLGLKQYQEAIVAFEKASIEYNKLSDNANDPSTRVSLAMAYAQSGQTQEARAILSELERVAQHRYVSPYRFIELYSSLGDRDNAFAWVERAYQERGSYLAYAKVDEAFFGLRDDPRYDEWLRRLSLIP